MREYMTDLIEIKKIEKKSQFQWGFFARVHVVDIVRRVCACCVHIPFFLYCVR